MNAVTKYVAAMVPLILLSAGARAQEPGGALAKAEEWERAAVNREWAAASQQGEADARVAEANDLIRSDVESDAERKKAFVHAANLLMQAGGLYGQACGSLDRAADNWRKAAAGYHDAGLLERERSAKERASTVEQHAVKICEQAAEAYEGAASAYDHDPVNQANRAAGAASNAAAWREKLATRR